MRKFRLVPMANFVFALCLLVGCATSGTAFAQQGAFAGGHGTDESPYLVATAEQLHAIRNHLDAHFRQIADINLDVSPWNQGPGWEPIGAFPDEDNPGNEPFSGVFDGNGFKISGLFINRPESNHVGLFGYASEAVFERMVLENVNIAAGRHVGALVGEIRDGDIRRSSSNGEIDSSSTVHANAGGLVGTNGPNGLIEECSSSAKVSGSGLGNRYVGGLVGLNDGGIISASNANGEAKGVWWVGGLVGSNSSRDNSIGEIRDSFANAKVFASVMYAGGLAGGNWLATISDSHSDSLVEGQTAVGGLVGFNTGGVIENSYATGRVEATGYNIGGLVGGNRLPEARITACYATGHVSALGVASYRVGGLVGYNHQGAQINQSFATGNVFGGSSTGGLVGANGGRLGTDRALISDSYATGSVFGESEVGGLVGLNSTSLTNLFTIVNSYAVGYVTPLAEHVGALVGLSESGGQVAGSEALTKASYFNVQTTGVAHSSGGEAKTTTEMATEGAFPGWDFPDVWRISEGVSYPYLAWQDAMAGHNRPQPLNLVAQTGNNTTRLSWNPPGVGAPDGYRVYRDGQFISQVSERSYRDNTVENYTTYLYQVTAVFGADKTACSNSVEVIPNTGFGGGSGTASDPFQVATAEHLDNVRAHRGAHFKQTADIDVGGYAGPNMRGDASDEWSPIGSRGISNLFFGTYDGNHKTISSLSINGLEEDYVGLFGYVRGGRIRNVKLEAVNIAGKSYVGGLVGYLGKGADIEFSHVNGRVSSAVGQGNFVDGYYIGGLAGKIEHAEIRRSSSRGQVTTLGYYAGGLVGQLTHGKISNSFSFADVSGKWYVGGLLGENFDGGVVENCYAIGNVDGEQLVGGLVGFTRQSNVSVPAQTRDSYWDAEHSAVATSGGGIARNTAEMTSPHAQNTYVGWDFMGIWSIAANVNRGYPMLRAEPVQHTITVRIGAEGGRVLGAGSYPHGATVTLTAEPDHGYRFLYWKDAQGKIISSDTVITFQATSGRTLTAHFEEQPGSLPGVLMLLLDDIE